MLNDDLDFTRALLATRDFGFAFVDDIFPSASVHAILEEVRSVKMELVDNDRQPIRAGKPNQVRQKYLQAPVVEGASGFEMAVRFRSAVIDTMRRAAVLFPELAGWKPRNACYQLYRDSNERITPHRDPASDHQIVATATIDGQALVRMYEAIDDPNDYSSTNLRQIYEHQARSGSIMLLRTTGFGSGERIIHEVLPPQSRKRLVLALR